ncbi:hypothetical protein EDD86DRAFT_209879 [Gorgonomyces haynaldii]|nr:hypothetical protein EDD86DRAFT_209879 [Gorgonomyces haynaldii]
MSLKKPAGVAINPLSNPKGVSLGCELCGKPAYIQCKSCRVTYYCDKDHQNVDFKGIHSHICTLLAPLRSPVTILGSEEERAQRQRETLLRQQELLKIAKTEAHKLLFESHFDLAIPAALQALRFSMLIHGQDSIEIVPSYLLLGEASIGLKQYKEAEDYLSLAKWAILKAKDCDNAIKSQLHRNFGQLYASQGIFDKAMYELALDIYYMSSATGPEHVAVTGGYYQLGQLFQRQAKDDHCAAFYDKVVAILKQTLKQSVVFHFNSAQIAEAVQMLTSIHQFRVQKDQTIQASEAYYVLAQVHYLAGQTDKAKEKASKSLESYENTLGREHSLTIEVRQFLKTIMQANAPKESTVQ